ncbi:MULTISPECIES: hypothetical protein [Cytobacillus]|uniref:NAD(P)-dependent oxidoreductase n=1 Tax=Cytobacillus stercorigallinarum TaxID=2762240 RepID=A0ABR8QRC0_9BACI|nr:hypothetical protein [Cytobacillus stercorigallinarum]MBD7938064.1 hypothetical protein [Cytobacillus stercorigallinarum]
MKQAVVIDGYSFVGFGACKGLLEEGEEVLLFNSLKADDGPEKQLSIGRNANLTEVDMNSLQTLLEEEATVFIDGYSLYIKDINLEQFLVPLLDIISFEKRKCVIILPIQWLYSSESKKWVQKTFSHAHIYYLPTVYGPFQPEEMLFQQKLMHPSLKKSISEKEWRNDAVYIDEAITCLLHDFSASKKSGEKIINSGIENHWQQCADYLQINLESHTVDDDVSCLEEHETIYIKNHLSVEKGLRQQKRHVDILL